MKKIYELGIRSFDVASINEIKLVKNLFNNSKIYFMNPVKPRHIINEAYHKYGVRDFSLDNETELHKILESTGSAKDLNLHLRISVPNNSSKINLSKKFGTDGFKSKVLLNKIKNISRSVKLKQNEKKPAKSYSLFCLQDQYLDKRICFVII